MRSTNIAEQLSGRQQRFDYRRTPATEVHGCMGGGAVTFALLQILTQ